MGDSDDDLFGGDIYGDAGAAPLYAAPPPAALMPPAAPAGDTAALQAQCVWRWGERECVRAATRSAPIIRHRPFLNPTPNRLAAATARITELEQALSTAHANADRWRAAADEAAAAAAAVASAPPPPTAAPGDPSPADAAAAAVADKTLENVTLRAALAAVTTAATPAITNARQLLLDPSAAREFERLRSAAAAARAESATARDALAAVPGGAGAVDVAARVGALQAETAAAVAAAADGAVAVAERRAAAAEALLDDARRAEAAAAARVAAAEARVVRRKEDRGARDDGRGSGDDNGGERRKRSRRG